MSVRVINSVEKNVINVPLGLVTLAAGVAQDILTAISGANGEYAARYIQNVGTNPCYYSFGHDTDKTNFNGILAGAPAVDANGFGPGQQLDVSNCGQRVNCMSVAGTTIAITVLKRNDNTQGSGGILSKSYQQDNK